MHKNAIKILIYLNTGRLLGPRLLNFCIYTFQGCLMRPRQLFGTLEYWRQIFEFLTNNRLCLFLFQNKQSRVLVQKFKTLAPINAKNYVGPLLT